MTWPAVFDGVGALVVSCALDPDALADRIPGLTWISYKVGGTDVADDTETRHCIARWRSRGLKTGPWTYCTGPPRADIQRITGSLARFGPFDFCVYDVEAEYKADEGGHYEWAAALVAEHGVLLGPIATAVTSYGGYKTSLDFAAFADAGWPMFAQVYDSYVPGDEASYVEPGPYPAAGVHRLTRSLAVAAGDAVYRPESING